MPSSRASTPSRRSPRLSKEEPEEASHICSGSPLVKAIGFLNTSFDSVVAWSMFTVMILCFIYFGLWSTKALYKIVVEILVPMSVAEGIVLLVGAFTTNVMIEALI